jgi:hypothetical protein
MVDNTVPPPLLEVHTHQRPPLFIITDIKCNEIVNIIILQYLFSIENQV